MLAGGIALSLGSIVVPTAVDLVLRRFLEVSYRYTTFTLNRNGPAEERPYRCYL